MSANPRDDLMTMTEAEYLEFERDSEIRHEYIQGVMVAMSGASQKNNRIVGSAQYLFWFG